MEAKIIIPNAEDYRRGITVLTSANSNSTGNHIYQPKYEGLDERVLRAIPASGKR